MPGPAARLVPLLWALLLVLSPAAPAWARSVGSADGPGDIALAIGLTTAAAAVTGLWLRSRYRRKDPADGRRDRSSGSGAVRADRGSSGSSRGGGGGRPDGRGGKDVR
ncbi:hypothetical protein KPP03845_104099 [Streptomyces xanthophaeus]|uniref:hypothetical protein n=1 Tax=Streptomyces xanthophaeus TaxID=67385 RepID=UPI00233F5DE0|nr:hypothetical protein [Streptomyces xanthophaeus]WCD87699.1 hypothetical protein KPP03845_104099 [Streptomyces xanthophaeus]